MRTRVRAFDAIVVLGAALASDGRPSPTLMRRLEHGLALYRRGSAAHLILTGGRTRPGTSEAEAMAALALADGVPARALFLDTEARSTLENAVNAVRIMRAQGWRRALVVSDRFHLPRALLTFRVLGVRVRGGWVRGAWHHGPFRRRWHYPLYELAAIGWYLVRLPGARRRLRAAGRDR